MAKASISLRSLNETLNRVEAKLQGLEVQFTELDCSLQSLAHSFDLQAKMMEQDLKQDVPWASGERLGAGRGGGRGGALSPLQRGGNNV